MGLQGAETAAWFSRAKAALVSGVSSGFRYVGDDDTFVISRGEGAYVYDMDGKRYIDYQLGYGPIILGHGHPAVVAAVSEAAAAGTTFAMTTSTEVVAAERVKQAVPWVDRLRFTNTGTEATMHAIRLARAVTGRELIVKFEGAYHGAHDYVLFTTATSPPDALGSRRSPVPHQVSSGIPTSIRHTIRVVPFNDLDAAQRLFDSEGRHIAAFIVEPMLGNVFGVLPRPGFLEGIRALCDRHGSLLVFDEVKTGFRLALGGAAEAFGVVPDVSTFAKSMGNGFPVAAIAGKEAIVGAWETGGVTQAGTYSGNGIAAAAASATIGELMSRKVHRHITEMGSALMEGLARACSDAGVAFHVTGHPSMFSLYLGEDEPLDFRAAAGHDADLYQQVVHGMVRRGVMPCDDALEPWFVCGAHTSDDVTETLRVFEAALTEARA
jgi:glutamate-1-semialdehyde 2,1-aminomutase